MLNPMFLLRVAWTFRRRLAWGWLLGNCFSKSICTWWTPSSKVYNCFLVDNFTCFLWFEGLLRFQFRSLSLLHVLACSISGLHCNHLGWAYIKRLLSRPLHIYRGLCLRKPFSPVPWRHCRLITDLGSNQVLGRVLIKVVLFYCARDLILRSIHLLAILGRIGETALDEWVHCTTSIVYSWRFYCWVFASRLEFCQQENIFVSDLCGWTFHALSWERWQQCRSTLRAYAVHVRRVLHWVLTNEAVTRIINERIRWGDHQLLLAVVCVGDIACLGLSFVSRLLPQNVLFLWGLRRATCFLFLWPIQGVRDDCWNFPENNLGELFRTEIPYCFLTVLS